MAIESCVWFALGLLHSHWLCNTWLSALAAKTLLHGTGWYNYNANYFFLTACGYDVVFFWLIRNKIGSSKSSHTFYCHSSVSRTPWHSKRLWQTAAITERGPEKKTLENFRLKVFHSGSFSRWYWNEAQSLPDEFLLSSRECAKAVNFLSITTILDIMLMRCLRLPLKSNASTLKLFSVNLWQVGTSCWHVNP